MDGVCPAEVPLQDNDVVGAIEEVCSEIEGRRRCSGRGVRFVRERVVLDGIARMSLGAGSAEIAMSVSADYPAFMAWLEGALR